MAIPRLVDLGGGAGRGREAQVAAGERLLAATELREQFRLSPFCARVGRFRIAEYADRTAQSLSKGNQQKVQYIATILHDPDVLLMDEPFAAVDAQTREILQFELLRIWESRPTSMIFVTHSIEEAVLMGDRVFVLKGRPSSIQKIVEVDLPHPRTRETLQQARFAELRELVWSTLMKEAREAEFQLGA